MRWFALVLTAIALDFNRDAVISAQSNRNGNSESRQMIRSLADWDDGEQAAAAAVAAQTTSKPSTLPLQNWNHSSTLVHVLNWEIDYVNFVRYRHVYWLFVFVFFCNSSHVKWLQSILMRGRAIEQSEGEREREKKKCTHGNHQFAMKRRGSTVATMRNGMQCNSTQKKNRCAPAQRKQINQVIIIMEGIGA